MCKHYPLKLLLGRNSVIFNVQVFIGAFKGGRASYQRADVRSEQDVKSFIDTCVQKYSRIDIAFNNAGVESKPATIAERSLEEWMNSINTNATDVFLSMKGDAIINTGSVGGTYGAPNMIDYSATKGAIHSFTKALALNLGPRGIRVNAVVPGPIWTPLQVAMNTPETAKAYPTAASQMSASGRSGQPEEVAPTYVYLAANDGSYTSGSLIEVHGGWIGW